MFTCLWQMGDHDVILLKWKKSSCRRCEIFARKFSFYVSFSTMYIRASLFVIGTNYTYILTIKYNEYWSHLHIFFILRFTLTYTDIIWFYVGKKRFCLVLFSFCDMQSKWEVIYKYFIFSGLRRISTFHCRKFLIYRFY